MGYPQDDDRSAGLRLAVERLQRYNVKFSEDELLESDAIYRAVNSAMKMLIADEPPGRAPGALNEFTIEAVAFGAMIRVIAGAPELSFVQVRKVVEIFGVIFAGIVVR